MKVCLLTRYFTHGGREGVGIGRVSGAILQGLVKRGISVQKISTSQNGLYAYFWYTLVQTKLKIKKGHDIYHALTPMESIWIPKDKSLVTFHDLFQISNPERLGGGMGYSNWKHFVGTNYFEIVCRIASSARILVCVSEKTKEDVIKHLKVPEQKIRVIRLGVNGQLRARKKIDNVFRLGYLGMLDRRKRVDLLIGCYKKSRLDGELVITGRGLDESLLKEKAEGDSRIKFLGFIPEDNLSDFYNSLDAFVFPTWLEGYGLPIVEAMVCKKPVIVMSDALIPQEVKSRCVIIEDLGVVLNNQTHLERLCKSVDLESNYQWAKSHSWDKCVESYIELYREILEI